MQKVVLYMGIAITVLMVLFPPWTSTYKISHLYNPNDYIAGTRVVEVKSV